MNKIDFMNSNYIVCKEGYGSYSYHNSFMQVVEGFATEDAAVAYMNNRPCDILFLCKGPYMQSKPKPLETEVIYMK